MIAGRGSARGPCSPACAAGKPSVPSGRHSNAASATATIPSTIQVARELQGIHSRGKSENARKGDPDADAGEDVPRPVLLAVGLEDRHGPGRSADQHEGARHARQEPQRQPQRRPFRKSHQEGGEADTDEAPADRERGPRRQHNASEGAEEIADVIAGREPTADGQGRNGRPAASAAGSACSENRPMPMALASARSPIEAAAAAEVFRFPFMPPRLANPDIL